MNYFKKSQQLIEYCLFIGVVIGALLGMQSYLKRSLQGRFKDHSDSLGEMYSPKTVESYTITVSSNSNNEEVIEENGNTIISRRGSTTHTENIKFKDIRDEF